MSDESLKYKNSPQSELISSYIFDASLPLKKITKNMKNTLIPKLNLRISPHDMKYHSNTSRRIDIKNVFSADRLGLGDSFETGESLTLGVDFKKEKINQINKIVEIEEYFDFKLATVFRFNKEKDIPINSTLNEKTSNIFGLVEFKPTKDILLNYDLSLTNNLNIIEHQTISASYIADNFSTTFGFTEEAGVLGDSNAIYNETKLVDFKDFHNLSFSTRRNRKINLTEYYDIIYEYKNDCLIAGIKYRKDYYQDNDITPKEELFFSLTIIPFYTFSPDKMILNKNRID